MPEELTRPPAAPAPPDRTRRTAALWATAVAVPVAVLTAVLVVSRFGAADGAPPPARPAPPTAVPSAPVPLAAPELDAAAARTCRAVTDRLPATLRTLPRRPVTAGPAQNAAWGEPPVTLACGAAQRPLCERVDDDGSTGCVPLTAQLLVLDRVCWHVDSRPDAAVFSTMDRRVPVTVTVPRAYERAAEWAIGFSGALTAADPVRPGRLPYGCTG